MKVERLLATDARDGRYMDMIRATFEYTQPQWICAAVAYATHSGVAELDAMLSGLTDWRQTRKQWLVGIDYCRSDPLALAHLNKLPNSKVRIFDGKFVSGRKGCVPRNSYHPKAYLLLGSKRSAAVVDRATCRARDCFGALRPARLYPRPIQLPSRACILGLLKTGARQRHSGILKTNTGSSTVPLRIAAIQWRPKKTRRPNQYQERINWGQANCASCEFAAIFGLKQATSRATEAPIFPAIS